MNAPRTLETRDLERARPYAEFLSDARAASIVESNPLAGLSLALLLTILGAGFYWADRAVLDEVTLGEGEVIPSSREQVVQSLEGGILAALEVREGDIVEAGDVLLRIDDTGFGANFREAESRSQSLRAAIARLRAEADGVPLEFPPDIDPGRVSIETKLYRSRRNALEQAVAGLERTRRLAAEELSMTEPLVDKGIVSEVEVLRLRREVNDLDARIEDRRNTFRADAGAELAGHEAELAALKEVMAAREDQLNRAVVRAPMRGTVKNIEVTTVGGVIRPGVSIMEIVPLDDRLLVEARIKPADRAFLHPGLPTTVKITAYDSSIYGGLDGEIEHISADTIADERDPSESFYRMVVRTDRSHLDGKDGPLPIIPGMTATVEVLTGQKTVLDYILKPVLKTRDRALKER